MSVEFFTGNTAWYPRTAGFKEGTTSREAAEGIEASGKAADLRVMVLAWYAAGNTGTADDCARALGKDKGSIRPRCAEYRVLGVLEPTGERRKADGGRPAHVWRLSPLYIPLVPATP